MDYGEDGIQIRIMYWKFGFTKLIQNSDYGIWKWNKDSEYELFEFGIKFRIMDSE